MGKANDSIKYNRSYPELNGTDEGMIQHKERSGAKAAALIPTTTFVASATAAMLLLLLALARIALVRPALLTVTTNSAQVEVRTDLEGSEDAYPLVYLLVPYEPGQRDPVTPGGRLRLSEQEVEALGDPVLQGEIYTRVEQLLFQGLDNRFDYLLLFCSEDENGELVLRREALYIRMVRIGDPDSPNRPGPIPDDSTPKGPLAIAITPAPATPAPDPATPPQTATSSATATATSSATATATSTATATPYDETTPYIPPTDDSTPTPVVPHGITIRIIGGGQGFAGTDPEHLSSASELQANPGETVYIKGVPEDTDDVHYLFARYEVTSGSVSNWTSSSFVMGSTDVELTFTFVRAYRLSVVNEMPAWGTATYQGTSQDFPAGESVSIHCEPSTHYEFVVAHDETEHYYFTDPDFTFPMPEQDLTLFVMFDKILVGLTIEPASGGSCSYSPDAEMEVGNTYYFQEGSTVTIAATGVIEDHVFAGYYVNGSSTLITDDPLTLTMDSDTVVTPVFKQLYTIRFANDLPSYGTITCNGLTANEEHPAISVKAPEGETLSFQLTPRTGCEVGTVEVDPSGGGTLSSSGSTYTFTVGTGNANIYVYFGPKPGHQIHVSTVPDEDFLGCEITADIYGVDETFPPGATVTITPELEGPYAYDHMVINGGSYSNAEFRDNPVSITMPDANVYVTIYFTEIQLYTLTGYTDPDEKGDVYISGTGVEETSDGYTAPEGTLVTFSVDIDDEDYVLDYYTVNGTRIDGNTWPVSADALILAVLKPAWHEIHTTTDPEGIGSVLVSGDHANYVDGYYECYDNTSVSFEYVLGDDFVDDYRFVRYEVNGTPISNNSTTVTGDITVTAVFESKYHDIHISADPEEGMVYVPTHPPTKEGDTVSFNWTTSSGYEYSGYDFTSGEFSNPSVTSSSCSFTMGDTDVSVTIHFVPTHTVTVQVMTPGGDASLVNTNPVGEGKTVQISVSPDTGYHLDYLTVNGGTPTTSTTFTMPASDVLVQVYFAAGVTTYPISITASPAEGGIASASESAAAPGTTVYVSVGANSGYRFVNMVVDGVPYTDESISFIMPAHAVNGIAYFEEETLYPITQVVLPNEEAGSIYGPSQAAAGYSVHFSADPADGYHLVSFTVDGVSIAGNSTTITMPAHAITVSAVFEENPVNTYSIFLNVSGDEGCGTISGPKYAAAGDLVTVTVSPAPAYHFVTLWVNGAPQTSTSFTMPAQATTVWAEIEAD